MGLSSDLTGTPWHVDKFTREEGDDKRHRSRCYYYSKTTKRCRWYFERCRGSAHCIHYREDVPYNEQPEEKPKPIKPKESKAMSEVNDSLKLFVKYHPIGSRIRHKAFGNGVIKSYKANQVRVRFDSGKDTWLSIETCLKSGLFF